METVKVDIRSPFPWFGGKSAASELIWKRFGDVKNYVGFVRRFVCGAADLPALAIR